MKSATSFKEASEKFANRREMTVEESLEEHAKVLAEYWGGCWFELTAKDKAICIHYRNYRLEGGQKNPMLEYRIEKLKEKYDRFDYRMIP